MKLNPKLINTGSTRIVLLIGDYAIKIPRSEHEYYTGKVLGILRGWIGNRTEYMWSKQDLFPFLNRVVFSFLFSFIIVQRRVEMITEEEFFSLEKADYPFGGFEWKLDSFGKVNDKIVVIDYDGNV